MKPPKGDPVIEALHRRRPGSRNEFIDWVSMLAIAYGFRDLVIGETPGVPHVSHEVSHDHAAPANVVPLKPMPRYYIDLDGYGRRADGERIMPKELGGEILEDLRGEGDLGSIIWADGSTGVIGLQINIRAAA